MSKIISSKWNEELGGAPSTLASLKSFCSPF